MLSSAPMTRMILLATLLLASSPAAAYFDASFTQTFGSNRYRGTKLWADFGGDVHFKPAFSVYRSDVSNGTYKTLSARLGYDTKQWGAGVTAGGSPKVEGYSNGFFGADLTFSLTPGGDRAVRRIPGSPEGKAPKGRGLARIDVGGSLFHTKHRDETQAPAAPPAGPPDRRGPRRRAAAVTIGQTDLSANAGVSLAGLHVSAEATVSRYDKDLDALAASPAAVTRLPGLAAVIQGFPKASLNAQLELGLLPMVDPYVSITRTKFQMSGVPDSTAVTIGASAGFEIVEVHGSIERYLPGGGSAAQTYVGLGAGVRF